MWEASERRAPELPSFGIPSRLRNSCRLGSGFSDCPLVESQAMSMHPTCRLGPQELSLPWLFQLPTLALSHFGESKHSQFLRYINAGVAGTG